ncbi:hypothetical protein [Rheinheimera sp.]|uniref:hypothetical protein n=1 Tax=Rheinheimera sp. TaxID=1869214 RepID=UPI00307E6FFC
MTWLKWIAAMVTGLVLGSLVNMALIKLNGLLIALPAGVDMTTAEGIRAALPLLQPVHFLLPFLAHALGTLVGAFCAAWLASQYKAWAAAAIGLLFFCGGVMAARLIPAPFWFIAADLLVAYLPMAWLGYRLARRKSSQQAG